MRKSLKFSALLILFFAGAEIFSQESAESLLAGYFKNNLSLLNLSAEMDGKILDAKRTAIEQGFSVKLSTGTVQITGGSETEVTLSPGAQVNIPQADNLSLSASSSIDVVDGEKEFTNTTFKVSFDLISGNMQRRKNAIAQSEREVLEAKRNLQNGFLQAESEFYRLLRELYQIAVNITTVRKDLYEHQLAFTQIRAQGYAQSSSKYRLAEMEVSNDRHKAEVLERELDRKTRIFATKCGFQYDGDASKFLPNEIPQVEPVDINDFNKDDFAQTERAVWNADIGERKRKADKKFTLSANGGYTINNEIHRDERKDTVDAGTALTWYGTGVTANAGVSIPTNSDPLVYTFGITIEPNQFRLGHISRRQDDIDRSKEEIAILSAKSDYVTAAVSQSASLADIQWRRQEDSQNCELYTQLEADTAKHFSRGLVTESEYNSAKVNKENYMIQCLIDDIDLILYNNETKLYFTRDGELLFTGGNSADRSEK